MLISIGVILFALGLITAISAAQKVNFRFTLTGIIVMILGGMLLIAGLRGIPESTNVIKNEKYFLNTPDSPHISNVHLELDYKSNDTAYLNWYSNSK